MNDEWPHFFLVEIRVLPSTSPFFLSFHTTIFFLIISTTQHPKTANRSTPPPQSAGSLECMSRGKTHTCCLRSLKDVVVGVDNDQGVAEADILCEVVMMVNQIEIYEEEVNG